MATIVIDPGHYGGYNPGVCPGYYEGNTMLKLARYLGADLTAMGANVKYTRTTDYQNPSLTQRGQLAAGADLFISLHSDASDNPNTRGVAVFYSVQRPATEPFAAEIGRAVANVMGNSFNGTYARMSGTTPGVDYLGVLRSAVSVGAKNAFLVEHGYHSNYQDCLFLSNDANLRRIAAAEAEVIGRHFGLIKAPAVGCRFSYIVQPGETLFTIGQKFGIPWQDIAAASGISAPYSITAGQKLIIPYPKYTTIHIVQPSETLYLIASRYSVSWQEIAEVSGISAPYELIPGQKILIPRGCRFYYTIQLGDTLFLIGQMFGVPWQETAAENGIISPYELTVGQRIAIPLTII